MKKLSRKMLLIFLIIFWGEVEFIGRGLLLQVNPCNHSAKPWNSGIYSKASQLSDSADDWEFHRESD
jgi:hypothetical protein